MKSQILHFAAIIILLVTLPIMNTYPQNLKDLLPEKVNGYKAKGNDTYYNQENLFEYINGGAELFISYDFKEVISRRYTQKGQPDIVVEIFDMVESKNAFGVFSHDREKLDNTYGQGSETYHGAILFWKDRYYVSVFTEDETQVSGQALADLASSITDRIPGKGSLPKVLDYLPEEGLQKESVFYFHHYIWLNAFFYIASDNFLSIDSTTDAVLAKYGKPESRYYLLVVDYHSDEKALSAYNSFVENYAPELAMQQAVKLEDEKWTACDKKNSVLVCVFNAPEKDKAEKLLRSVPGR